MAERGSDIRPGKVMEVNGELAIVIKTTHTKPGKGGAFMQAELKNLITGSRKIERFRADEVVKFVKCEEIEYTYLFTEGSSMMLMDSETFEQFPIDQELLGDKKIYLRDNMIVKVMVVGDKIISVSVPEYLSLVVVETEVYLKGQTATSSYKPAVLENGVKIMVPPFIKVGDKITVYTPDDSYYERSKEN